MAEPIKDAFDKLAVNDYVSSVDVIRIVNLYGLTLTRRTVQKWILLGVIGPPVELNASVSTGHRMGFNFDAVVKIVALRMTLGAITGLGKGSRLKKRFASVAIALRYCEDKNYNIFTVAKSIDLKALGLANMAVNGKHYIGSPIKQAKIIRLVSLIFCFYYQLLHQGSAFDIYKAIKVLRDKKLFDSTQDSVGINESVLSNEAINLSTISALGTVMENWKAITEQKDIQLFKAWIKAVRYFDSNGWVAVLAMSSLQNSGIGKSFSADPKANWLAAVVVDD